MLAAAELHACSSSCMLAAAAAYATAAAADAKVTKQRLES
jgi:hypothetical protein